MKAETIKAKLISENTPITVGTVLYDMCPARGLRKMIVARMTKTLIIMKDGGRFSRHGYIACDTTYKRRRLYIAC